MKWNGTMNSCLFFYLWHFNAVFPPLEMTPKQWRGLCYSWKRLTSFMAFSLFHNVWLLAVAFLLVFSFIFDGIYSLFLLITSFGLDHLSLLWELVPIPGWGLDPHLMSCAIQLLFVVEAGPHATGGVLPPFYSYTSFSLLGLHGGP